MADLVAFVGAGLQVWQGKPLERVQQQDEGAKLDQQIAENLRRLGYEF
jgi:hypothetical protein